MHAGTWILVWTFAAHASPSLLQEEDITTLKSRHFQFPITITQPGAIEQLQLYVSSDQGKSWRLTGSPVGPSEKHIRYHADGDGEYWFALQMTTKQGTQIPADEKGL